MTVEEALVALLAAVASVFLFLGLAQVLGAPPPPPGRHPIRQPEGRAPSRHDRASVGRTQRAGRSEETAREAG